MKVFVNILSWIIFIGLIALIVYACNIIHFNMPRFQAFPPMSGAMVVFFGLSLAFTWVEILKWGRHNPFNCVKCLTGWFSLGLAFLFHVEFWYLYLFAGLFAGAMYTAIKMRWL